MSEEFGDAYPRNFLYEKERKDHLGPNRKYLVLTIYFLFHMGCASILKGNSQEIEIKAFPRGAQIFLNNEPKAITPYTFTLMGSERRKEYVLRIEKEGYHPYEVKMERKWRKWSVINNMVWGALPAFGWWFSHNLESRGSKNPQNKIILSFVLSSTLFSYLDYLTGAMFEQHPTQIAVQLTPKR